LRFLNFNSAQSGHSIAKLASGSRIVRASDDAAGLAISSRLSADTSILRQSSINAAQGVSVLQVADGGLARISDVLQRLAALGAQSLSGVPSDTERGFIDAEFQQLLSEIDGIVASSTFNGQALLDSVTLAASNGGLTNLDFFVGTRPGDTISVDFAALATVAGVTVFDAEGLGFGAVGARSSVDNITNATLAFTAIDAAIDTISEARANVGAFVSRFEFRSQQIATSIENIRAANSAIKDVDLAAEQSKLVSSQVLVQASVSALSQANQLPQALLKLLQ
jgi:flagellin